MDPAISRDPPSEGLSGTSGKTRGNCYRRVFVGDYPVGDAGVDEGHLEGAVSEERGDRFEAHAPVDGLGGEGVAELVGVR